MGNEDFKIEWDNNSKIYSTVPNPDIRKPKNSPCSFHPGKTTIYGFIKNSEKYIESNPRIHFLYHDYITIQTNSVYAPIDSLGRFQLEMELLSAQDIVYRFDNKIYPVFVSPDDTLMIYFDPDHPEEVDFQGNNSDVNYDMLHTRKSLYAFASQKDDRKQLSKHFHEYKAYKDSARDQEMWFLNEYAKNDYCSECFKTWFRTNTEVRFYTDLLNYNWKNNYSNDIESSMEAFNAYVDTFFEKSYMSYSVAPITGRYFLFTNAVYNKLPCDKKSLYNSINSEFTDEERNKKYREIYITKMSEIINEIEAGRLKDILFASLVSRAIKNRQIDYIDKSFDVVDELIDYQPYVTHLSNYVVEFKRKEAEFENNPILLRKSGGSGELLLQKIIEDNADKVVILDFWFTGCGACRRDFKSMGPFKKDLALEADVEFVYLCYSSTENNWKYVSKEYNLQGQNYLLTQEQFMYFQELFSISGAPHYILINKAGRVVNSDFSPPKYKRQFITAMKNAI